MTTDPIEAIVEAALTEAGIKFEREAPSPQVGRRLDFYLPDHEIYIECKAFGTARTFEQIGHDTNALIIQGRRAAETFRHLISAAPKVDSIVSMLDGRNTATDIARAVGTDENYVRAVARRHNLPIARRHKERVFERIPVEEIEIRRNMTAREIASDLGIQVRSVRRAAQRYGIDLKAGRNQ